MSRKIVGICKLCGVNKVLSYEHTPPRSAGNSCSVTSIGINKLAGLSDFDEAKFLKGFVYQRGLGGYTLCIECNNNTGSWYGNPYKEWFNLANLYFSELPIHTIIKIEPLSVLKQIALMFLCNLKYCEKSEFQMIREFIIQPERLNFPDGIKIYAALKYGDFNRVSGFNALYLDGNMSRFSEIAFSPFLYVMTFELPPPSGKFLDLTGFSDYRFREVSELKVRWPILNVNTSYPGDYRSREEIY